MRTTVTAHPLSFWGFTPAPAATEDIVRDEAHRPVESEGKHVWYEALLLLISFIFLLLGVLPAPKNAPAMNK